MVQFQTTNSKQRIPNNGSHLNETTSKANAVYRSRCMSISSTLHPSTRVAQAEQSISTVVEGEVVMMNLETNSYYGLDAIGSRIWDLIEEPKTIAEVCAQLMLEYEVDADTCVQEVSALIASLIEEQLARVVSE
jgi:hypothetical protein